MSDAQDEADLSPPPPPLFQEDFGVNGGVLAPTSVAELQQWVSREITFWGWAPNIGVGPHRNSFDLAWRNLSNTQQPLNQAAQLAAQGDIEATKRAVLQVASVLRTVYTTQRLPHSSTPWAHRIEELRANPAVAHAYLYALMGDAPGQSTTFGPATQEAWRGFLMGLTERYGIVNSLDPTVATQRIALDEVREKASKMLEEKKQTIEELERNYSSVAAKISTQQAAQQGDFNELLTEAKGAHETALKEHQEKLDAVAKSFREKMALRSPVEYWQKKAEKHTRKAKALVYVMFGGMAVLALAFLALTALVFSSLNSGKPDTWKIAAPILVGVVAVWAVRLIVRMYLSQAHLATDAEERVTMVQTYLSLLEEGKMPETGDRQLVLTPLFRPATDWPATINLSGRRQLS